MNELYCDGGVIGRNPSAEGGTWAWKRIDEGFAFGSFASGLLLPAHLDKPTVSNNNTELKALCEGVLALPEGWEGIISSDSRLALGWVFGSYKQDSIPPPLIALLKEARHHRNSLMGRYTYRLLGGHPTKNDLAVGYRESRKPHLPVSIHNCWCDEECRRLAQIHRSSP